MDELELKPRHLDILNSLDGSDLKVPEIVGKTGIPKGKIYDLLNELIDKGLIGRYGKNPKKYTTKNLFLQMKKSLSNNFVEQVKNHIKVLNLLEEEPQPEKVIVFSNSEDYFKSIMVEMEKTNSLKVLCRHKSVPFVLYPNDRDEFLKIRKFVSKKRKLFLSSEELFAKMNEKYHQFLNSGKRLEYIIDRESIDNYFNNLRKYLGKVKFNQFRDEIYFKLKNSNLSINVIENNYQYSMFVSDTSVFINVAALSSSLGLSIYNKETASVYSALFEDIKSISESLGKLSTKMLGIIKEEDKYQKSVKNLPALRVGITPDCNLHCLYCPPHGDNFSVVDDSLSIKELLNILEISYTKGIRIFKITGGEPLLAIEKLRSILNLLSSKKQADVSITTNGILLKKYVNFLSKYNLSKVRVSLDTIDKQEFKKITGVDGFENVVEGIRAAKKAGISIRVNAVIMKRNSDIKALIDFCNKEGIDIKLFDMNYFDEPGKKE